MGRRDYREAARAGEQDAVWWEYNGDGSGGVHVCIRGREQVLSPEAAREAADRIEEEGNWDDEHHRLSLVSDLRESAESLEHVRSVAGQ